MPLRRGDASRMAVSGWETRGRSAKTPRNRGNLRVGSCSARGFSGRADWLAERMEFEPPVFPVGRIGSETEPLNLATEKNTGCGVFQARNPQSPVRIG